MASVQRHGLNCWLVISIICIVSTRLYAQTCPTSSSCDALLGQVTIPSTSTPNVPNRIQHVEVPSPDGRFVDNALSLTYNGEFPFFRDDATQPQVNLTMESYYSGDAELDLNMTPPNSNVPLRPFGFYAAYDGSSTGLAIGGQTYTSGAAGVRLTGGTHPQEPVVNITGGTSSNGLLLVVSGGPHPHDPMIDFQEGTGSVSSNNILETTRADGGSNSFSWRAGGIPRLNFSLDKRLDAASFGAYGVLKFVGEWDYGEPIMDFEGLGTGAMLIRSVPAKTDSASRFTVLADGQINWGGGTAGVDTHLYRSAVNTLHTDGNLVVGGNLLVAGSKSAFVQTASYGKRAVYAVESAAEWFEDFGSGKLVGGRAVIEIDPVFGETVNTVYDYHVFLTSNGPCSLYVARKERSAFTVKMLRGSSSCRFDYRIVASRKGYENVRLTEVSEVK
jgi:hypothetical protein